MRCHALRRRYDSQLLFEPPAGGRTGSACSNFYPTASARRMKELALFPKPLTIEGISTSKILERVHWSWFLPTLKSYSSPEQSLFLAALDEQPPAPSPLKFPAKLQKSSSRSMGRSYLRQVLLDSLIGPHDRLLPVDCLPPSPLNGLLESFQNTADSIDRSSGDARPRGGNPANCRDKNPKKNLQFPYRGPAPVSENDRSQTRSDPSAENRPRPLGWQMQSRCAIFSIKEGSPALGLALSGEDPSLAWYVCHLLDIGRGSALFKMCEREAAALPWKRRHGKSKNYWNMNDEILFPLSQKDVHLAPDQKIVPAENSRFCSRPTRF